MKLFSIPDRMSPFTTRLCACISLALLLGTGVTQASVLTWDPAPHNTVGSDGSGNWQSGTDVNWATGGADIAWIPGADASIGAGVGLLNYDVAVKLAVTVGNITFNQMTSPGKYTVLCSATLTMGGLVTDNNTTGTTSMGRGTMACGSVTFTKDGAGTLKLSSATLTTTANPAVEIKNGILQMGGADNNLPTTGVVQVDSTGTFDLAGVNQTIAALTGSGTVKNSGAGIFMLTVGNNNASGSFSGRMGPGSGILALTKTGSGTQTMSGTVANTAVCNITNNGGSLIFASGSTCASNLVTTVNSGAGNTLGVQLAAAGAQWACSNLIFGTADSGTYALSIDYNNTTPSTTTAPIICSNLTPHSTITLTISGFPSSFTTTGTYPLISYNPANSTALTLGQFADFTLAPLPSGYVGNLVNDTANFLVSLQITSVPCSETVTMSPGSPLTPGTVDVSYSQTFTGAGGTGPYSFSVVAGSLPGGITLDSGGLLSGTTTAAGTFGFTVKVTDTANGCFNNYVYSLTINPGAIASYTVTAASPQIQYTPFAVTVTAKDSHGNVVTTDSSTSVTMSSSTGNALFDSNGDGTYGDSTKTLSSGTFSIQARDNTVESVSIIATDGGSKTGTSSGISINPPPTLTWDPSKTPATASDGSGSWTAGTANWATAGFNVAWSPGANAVIGVGGNTNATIKFYPAAVANLTFNQMTSSGYTLSAANVGNLLTFAGGTVTVNNTAAPTTVTKVGLDGPVTFTKSGSGILQLSSCISTYTGPTVVAQGMLRIFNNSQQLPLTAPIEVDGTATFDLFSKDQIVDALSGSGTVDNTSTAGSSTLTVGNNNGSGTFSGVIQNTGANRTLAITKAGTGIQTLNNVNTYAGYTTINAGTLALGASGSINNSVRLVLVAGGTFDVSAIASYTPGSGITNLVASGTGTAVGTTAAAIKGGTTVGLPSSMTVVLTYDGANPALYISQGTLTLNNNPFSINSGSVLADGDYTIIQQASGSIGGTVASSTVTGTALTGKIGTVSLIGGIVNLHVCSPAGAAGTITGSASANPGDAGVSYSIAPVGGATSYAWTVPTGATVASGQGTDSITVNYSCSAVSGNVGVTPGNSCGNGAASSLAVTVNALSGTSPISGLATVNANESGVAYSVISTAGSTYNWSVPAGASITAGQGSSAITVTFGTSSGNVSVTETSVGGCAKTPVNLAVLVLQAPILTSVQLVAPGSVQITFSGQSGQTYKVWKTSDITLPTLSWTQISNGTFGASAVTYTDNSATGSMAFYRITSP